MKRPTPIDEEFLFKDGVIVSSTDLKGIITYANRTFCDISGYTKKELTGKNHNIVRHPDMPKAAFKDMWDTIKAGNEWTGVVKNLRKDGRYYWVYTHVAPIKDDQGTIIGYTAVRRPASDNEKQESTALYAEMRAKES